MKTHALDETRRRRQLFSLKEELYTPDRTCVEIDNYVHQKEAVDDRVHKQRWYFCTIWVLRVCA